MGQSDTLISIDFTADDDPWYQKIGKFALRSLNPVGAVLNIAESVAMLGDSISGTVSKGKEELALDKYSKEDYPDVLYLPLYTLSAEEIFKGTILMFDIDFFNPKQVYIAEKGSVSGQADKYKLTKKGREYAQRELAGMSDHDAIFHIANRYDLNNADTSQFTEEGKKEIEKLKISEEEFHTYLTLTNPTKLSSLSKEELATKDINYYYYLDEDGNEVRTSQENTASALSSVISKWYKALRNIALVLMMSILLYIGIRILLSTVSSDKAKYKQMLTDWLVGICLLFLMHYIMAFSVTLTNKFIKVITSIDNGLHEVIFEDDKKEFLSNGIKKAGYGQLVEKEYIAWPTNLMGRVRIATEMRHGKVSFIGFAICFLVLVFYTIFFAFTYLKRVLYLAFLTIIAPFVAMTYPIDKVNDGQAQGFNKWLKEYIFNLLIQPLHLLLYTILVSSVFAFASQNVWYMLVAIGFLIPAEKLLRSLFGFEKASTPGSLAGAALGASMISNGVGKLLHKMPGSSYDKSNKNADNNSDSRNPRMSYNDEDFDAADALMGGTGSVERNEGNNTDNDGNNTNNGNPNLFNQNQPNGLNPNDLGGFTNPAAFQPNLAYQDGQGQGLTFTDGVNSSSSNRSGNPMSQLPRGTNAQNHDSNNSPKKKKKSRKSLRRALKAGVHRTFTGKNTRRRIKNFAKRGIRMAAGTGLALTAGTIGVAAAVASGDASNVLQYGTAGLGAGYIAGSKMAGGTMNRIGTGYDNIKNSETRQAMTEAYYGEQYREKQQNKQIKEWKKNIEYKEGLERAVGERNAKHMYKNGEIDEYLKRGVDDVSDMAAMHELRKKRIANSIPEAIALHQYGERIGGDYAKLKEKDKKEWRETFSEEFQGKGYSEEQSVEASKKTLDKIKQYHELRKNFKARM